LRKGINNNVKTTPVVPPGDQRFARSLAQLESLAHHHGKNGKESNRFNIEDVMQYPVPPPDDPNHDNDQKV
jgi:hypothetical protein